MSIHLFLLVICSILIIGFVLYSLNKFDNFTVKHAPEILTTLGIAGCFASMFVAFFSLDVNLPLSTQIPELISSIKFSFLCSLLGIICALVIKFKHRMSNNKNISESQDSILYKELILSINSLRNSIVNNEQDSLLNQLKLMRHENKEQMLLLNKNFSDFIAKVVNNSSNAIIEALEKVIGSFNTKISDQLGDNFKELNHSIKNLIVWQDKYKEDLNNLISIQNKTSLYFKESAESYAKITENSISFVEASNSLSNIINGIHSGVKQLNDIEKDLYEGLVALKQVTPDFSKKTQEILSDLRLNTSQIFSDIQAHEKSLVATLQSSHIELKELLNQTIKTQNQELSSHLSKMSQYMNDQVVALDKSLNDELNKSLNSLARAMTSMSGQFVEDYGTITDKFHRFLKTVESVTLKN